jgi:hypothetical protein
MGLVSDIRAALADNLGTLEGINISPYLRSNPTLPTLMIMPGPPGGGDFTEYHQTMGNGMERMTFTVRTEVGVLSDVGAQQKLDEFLDVDATGVMQAIESDKTLGSLVSDVIVRRSVAGLVSAQDGSQKIAAEWEVEVLT